MLSVYQKMFLQTALQVNALSFGEFTLKSGRRSPYFFNAGAFHNGGALNTLAESYAHVIWQMRQAGCAIDMLFGPAYKGIPLVAAVAIVLVNKYDWSLPWAFNRKEKKGHGEGGFLVGAPIADRHVLIIDDVLTAGTAIRQSLALLRQEKANPTALLVALDRMERIDDKGSALDHLGEEEGIYTQSVANLDDLLSFMTEDKELQAHLPEMQAYRKKYGA
ncbi:MAG: orotate phosphoribosyltransferase [Cardiobacteriales bacterium]|nr:MAG: orotate phosphoribosyltransferase [Cardiobacteriales bacterium]